MWRLNHILNVVIKLAIPFHTRKAPA